MRSRESLLRVLSLIVLFLMVGAAVSVVLTPVAAESRPLPGKATSEATVDVLLRSASAFDRAALSAAGVTPIVDYGDFVLASVSESTLGRLSSEGLVIRALHDRTTIYLGSVEFDTRAGDPRIASGLRVDTYEAGVRDLHLIQMVGPVKSEWIQALKGMGVRFYNYVPNFAFIVEMDSSLVHAVQTVPYVQWIGAYHPAYRISRLVYQQFAEVDTVGARMPSSGNMEVVGPKLDELGHSALVRSAMSPVGSVGVGGSTPSEPEFLDFSVLVLRSAPLTTKVTIQGRIHELYQVVTVGNFDLLRFSMDLADVPRIATQPGVYWIEPYFKPRLYDEIASQISAGNYGPITPGYEAWLASVGFSGLNVTVAVADSGVDTGLDDPGVGGDMHPELDNRTVAHIPYGFLTTAEDGFGHGTHVAGIVAGDNATGLTDGDGFSFGLGIAPNATIVNQRIFDSGGGWAGADYFDLGADAYNTGSSISSNSWGISSFGQYLIDDQIYDGLVRDADVNAPGDQQLIFEFSAGNAGSGAQSIGSPGNAKNVIATGASLNYRPTVPSPGQWPADDIDAIVGFSSRGPTADGRIKPEIVAPGTWVASLLSSASFPGWCWQNIDVYHEYCGGTSMSGPMVSGGAALFVEYYRNLMVGADPSPALTKAALVNGAVDMPPVSSPSLGSSSTDPIPNFDEGWGRLHLGNVLGFPGTIFYDDQQQALDTGTTFSYAIPVADSSQPFKVSLAWTDVPGMPGASPVLVNDLDLTVMAPDGTVYFGNNFALGWSVPGGLPDLLNNLENVYVKSSDVQLGVYIVNVTAINVPSGSQDYAIVISYGGGPTSQGQVLWERSAFQSSALAGMILADSDLDVDNATQDVAFVTATSDVGDSEPVALLEFGTASGMFFGNIQLTTAVTPPSDGNLTVVNGGSINISYTDASPPAVVNDTAIIDDNPPLISSVQAVNLTHNSAVIAWITDELASSLVRYDNTTPPTLVQSDGLATNHSVLLTALTPSTTYFFEVESTDIAGNTAVDDNGGVYYNFTTLELPAILLVDDDFGNPWETLFIDTLNALGEPFVYWEVASQGNPALTDIQAHTVVIWQASWPCAFDTTAQSTIAQYLDGGGRLILSGQDIGWCWSWTSFYSDYLNASWVADVAPTNQVDGVPGDPIGDGLSFLINGGDGANNNIWPDVVDPIAPAEISAQYASGPSTRSAILRKDTGTYAIAYLAFNFEGVSTPADRQLLMDRLLAWIIPPDFGARFKPGVQSGVSVPGGTVAYDLEIRNRGVATANDTFNIFWFSGPFGWSTSVLQADGTTPINDTNSDGFPDTGPIPSGGLRDLVIQVDVDPGALGGQEDVAIINATSVSDPNATAIAQVSTLVPPPGVLAGPNGYATADPAMSATHVAVVENTGGFPDVFDLSVSSSLGWPVALFEIDGVTPLQDTDNDGTVDTGTVAGLQTYPIIVNVSVPAGTPFDSLNLAVVTATSSLDLLQSDEAKFRVEVVGPPSPVWPTFQHDNARTGVAPQPFDLPISQVWTYAGTGGGATWTSPVVADGTVYYGSWSGYLMAVDAFSGQEKWATQLGPQFYFMGTPAVSDGMVLITYVELGTFANAISALDADTGQVVWTYYTAGFPSRGTPVVKAGVVYFGDSVGWVYALDAVTGSLVWSYPSMGQIVQGPSIVEGLVVAGNLANEVFALDLDGLLVWSQTIFAGVLNAPSGAAGSVYVSDLSGTVWAFDSQTGAILWSTGGFGPFAFSTPAYDQGAIFVSDDFGAVISLDAQTGGILWWTFPSWAFESSVIVNNGTVFAAALDGFLYLLDAASGGVVDAQPIGPAASMSSPAAVRGYLYISDEQGVLTAFAFAGAGVATTIDVTPPTATVPVGGNLVLEAFGFDKYGNPTPAQQYSWSVTSGSGSVLPISDTGDKALFLPGIVAGSSTLTVTTGTVSTDVIVQIVPGSLDELVVTPSAVSVAVGQSFQFTVSAFDAFGNQISPITATWSSTIGTIDANGLFTAGTVAGTGTVTASSGGVTAEAVVTVAPGPLDHVTATPGSLSLGAGSVALVTATGFDQFDNAIPGLAFSWTTTIGAVVPLGIGEEVVFQAGTTAGTGTLEATSGGVVVGISVQVLPAALVRLSIAPSSTTVTVQDTAQFDTRGYDIFDNELSGLSIAYAVEGGLGTIDANGLFTAGTVAGTGTVTASSGGVTAEAVVTVAPGPLDHVTATPGSLSLGAGSVALVTATGFDQFDNAIPGLAFSWTTTIGAVAPLVGEEVVFQAGTTAGTGTVTVAAGGTSLTVPVTVVPGPLASLAVEPTTIVIDAGESAELSAQGLDAFGNAISGLSFTWSSTTGSVTPSGDGSAATFLAGEAGSGTITATADGRSVTVNVIVNPLPSTLAQATPAISLASLILGGVLLALLLLLVRRPRRK